ncbi:MAG: twin-arginine translocase TatA/TatE family subunit [Candidatus Bathyarchaeia archaeon]|nr:twin-arginine translocase TatA/TatE family subunit [Candidatus Bathyarchaeota archaeon]
MIILLVVIAVILLWGPSKIPELARSLGRAKAEFEKASKEYLYEMSKSKDASGSTSDESILLIAKALGINTEGKTKDQLIEEIIINIGRRKQDRES